MNTRAKILKCPSDCVSTVLGRGAEWELILSTSLDVNREPIRCKLYLIISSAYNLILYAFDEEKPYSVLSCRAINWGAVYLTGQKGQRDKGTKGQEDTPIFVLWHQGDQCRSGSGFLICTIFPIPELANLLGCIPPYLLCLQRLTSYIYISFPLMSLVCSQGNCADHPPLNPHQTHPTMPSLITLMSSTTLLRNMFAWFDRHHTSVAPSTANEIPKQVTAIAVHVLTTVHTVIEPWPPGVPLETQSGELGLLWSLEKKKNLMHVTTNQPTVYIHPEYLTPPQVSVDKSKEGHITISRVGVHTSPQYRHVSYFHHPSIHHLSLLCHWRNSWHIHGSVFFLSHSLSLCPLL